MQPPPTSAPAAAMRSAAKASPTAKDVKDAVNAHDRVAPDKQPAFRSKVIAMARKGGHLSVIPGAWLNGRPGTPTNTGSGS